MGRNVKDETSFGYQSEDEWKPRFLISVEQPRRGGGPRGYVAASSSELATLKTPPRPVSRLAHADRANHPRL